ncbi:hypothetical protein NCS52_00478200 [Fusarium sp. LHS14.1]|nr:hypothetical protein NCS52_00478200 [Fusarium sp. LHS14.1]
MLIKSGGSVEVQKSRDLADRGWPLWVTRARTPKSPDDRLGRGPIRHKRLLDGGKGVCGSVLGSLGVRAVGDYLLGSAIDAEREQSFVENAGAIKLRSARAKWETVGLAGNGHLSS